MLAALEKAGVADNTLVFSTSDHGRCPVPTRARHARPPVRTILPLYPVVAQRTSRAQLDGCCDDSAFLRHVPEVIGRLDALAEGLAGRSAARTEVSHAG